MSTSAPQAQGRKPAKHTHRPKAGGRWLEAEWGTWLMEIAAGPSLRDLQGKLMGMAIQLARDHRPAQALCVMASEKVTSERLQRELALMRTVFKPELADRLHVARCDSAGGDVWLEPGLPTQLLDLVTATVHQTLNARRRAPGGTQVEVFAYLIRSWLAGTGPLMVKDIQAAIGASHPTVSLVLDNMKKQGVLRRLPDRRVLLERFPSDEWPRWLLANSQVRKVARYVDPSRHARGPHAMAHRLPKATRQRIAISGVVGALQHYPELDITSAPRLDLCIAPEPGREDLSFVQKLDAGLVRDDTAPYPVLAIHILSPREGKQFMTLEGQLVADPLECLVAMHDAKLYEPAADMLQHLIRQRMAQGD